MKGTIGLAFCSLFFICACTGTRQADLGAQNGRLRPCPNRPNCVSPPKAQIQSTLSVPWLIREPGLTPMSAC